MKISVSILTLDFANVEKTVREFVGSAEQFDDLTMLCIEYKGQEAGDPYQGDAG